MTAYPSVLPAEQLADAVEDVADLIQLDLGLDAVDELVDLLVGQVNANELLDNGHGVALELGHQVLVAGQLFDDLFDLCLDIHGFPSCLRWVQCITSENSCQHPLTAVWNRAIIQLTIKLNVKGVIRMSLQSTLKALSDPIRREILNLLKSGTMAAGDIAAHFDVTAAAVSRHLSVLREADLIRDKREGKFIYYELNASVLEEIMLWITDLIGE